MPQTFATEPDPSIRLDAIIRPSARLLGQEGDTSDLSDVIIAALRSYGIGVDSHSLQEIPDDDDAA